MKNSIAAIQQTRNLLLISILIISNIAHAQWTQMGPGAGGQERAVYLRDKGLGSFDFYVGSDVSGVWRTTGLNTNNWANPASYNYDFISDHEPMRFINEFYAPNQYTSDFLFVTNRSGIHKLNAATNALPMQKLWGTGQPFVNDIFISAEHTAGVHTLYFVTGNERVDNRMNHKDDNTNDFYWGTLDAASETTISNINSIKLNNLLIRPHVYCMHVDEKNLTDQTDDEFMLGTDSGLYKFTLQQAIDAVTNNGGVLPSSTQIGWPYLSGVIDSYDTIDKGNLLAVTDIMRYNSLQAPNDFMITIYGLGLFYWDNITGTWQWQMNKLECRKQGPNSTYILYDPTHTQNPANFLDSANNVTRILPVNTPGTSNRIGYLLFNEEPLKSIDGGKGYIGIYYSPVGSNNEPSPDWVALSASTNMTNNDYGWNTTRPCSNRNGMLLLPDNRLIVGASGNIFVTKDPITNITGTVKWQQIYTSTVASSILDLPEYQHRGYVNTANKTIYPATDNEIWIGQADRLVFKSDDGVNGFYDIENPASPYTITYTGTNSNIPKTDCWFITNNKVDAADQNIYIGIGEGFATNVGNGHVMQVHKNKTDITQLGDQIVGGDPVKILFTMNNSVSQTYLLANDVINLAGNHRRRIRCLQGSVWTPNTLNAAVTLAPNYDVLDFAVTKDGTKLFAIIESGNATMYYRFANTNATTWTEECSDVVINNTDLSPRILKLYYYDNGTKYKVLCGTAPNSINLATSNLYEVYDSNLNNPCSTITAINNTGGILFFQNLNYDEGDATDGGITAIEINEHLNVIYVAAMRYEPPAIVSSHIYRATYDPSNGNINANSWTDVSNFMHNKAVIAMSTNGRSVCNESDYACLRGLGGWILDLPQGTVNQITQADFSSSTSITKSGLLSGPVVCGTSIVTIDGANIGITDPTVTISVGQGQTLNIINGASLFACGDMWQGIINNGGTVKIENSSIDDAKNIVANNGGSNGKLTATNSTFDHNYIGFSFLAANFGTSSITGCTFKCTGGQITKAPYNGQQTRYHISISAVDGLTIGNSALNKNTFQNASKAIFVTNSNVEIINNQFEWIPNNLNTWGEAIYIDGKPTISTIRKIGGSANANDKNTFINWKHNIIVNNAGKILIENNVINPLAANRSTVGISKQKCTDVTIKGNAINRTNNGIMLFDNAGATVTVTLNTFNKNLPYDFAKYDDEAIRFENNLYLKTKIYTITSNQIYNVAIGIHGTNTNAVVNYNTYHTDITTSDLNTYTTTHNSIAHRGIWVQNATGTSIVANTIDWAGTVTLAQLPQLQGVRVQGSFACNLQENIIKHIGAGIDIFDDCSKSTFYCNLMERCYNGVYFDINSVNNKLTDQGTTGVSWYNRWDNNVATNHIDGNFTQTNLMFWNFVGAIDNPNPQPFSIIYFQPIQVGSILGLCTQPEPLMSEAGRNALFGAAIGDSSITDYDSLEYANSDKTTFYVLATEDSTILYLGTASDAKYQAEYDSITETNIGKFEDAKTLLLANAKQLASQKLASMQDQNAIDQNKIFMGTLLAIGYDPALDADSDTIPLVMNIAMQHPFYGGEAVYIARAMLHVNVEDVLPPLRRKKPTFTALQNETLQIKFYPNPAKNTVTIISTTEFENGTKLILQNAMSSLIQTIELPLKQKEVTISLNQFADGIYFAKLVNAQGESKIEKLVILK